MSQFSPFRGFITLFHSYRCTTRLPIQCTKEMIESHFRLLPLVAAAMATGARRFSLPRMELLRLADSSSVRRSRPGHAQMRSSTACRPSTWPSRSSVNTTCTGRRFRPPTQELKHMNWNRLVTHSAPAVDHTRRHTLDSSFLVQLSRGVNKIRVQTNK